jgi:LuxR family transcriptional regulator, maltose regulon positive regulatory protein
MREFLATKLYLPSLSPDFVLRQQLVDKAEKGLNSGHLLTLVSAPAGYGKTTFVRQWLAPHRAKVLWLTLEKTDNNFNHFLAYLVTSLEKLYPDFANLFSNLNELESDGSELSRFPGVEQVGIELMNNLYPLSGRLVLVLDDYQIIQNALIHELVDFLLKHAPPNLHFVIISREEPPLALARLRLNQQLSEFRLADLQFSLGETYSYFTKTMLLHLSERNIHDLVERTEGWIAGLQFAALSLQGRQAVAECVRTFSGSHRYIIDYLAEEVFNPLPAELKSFLCQTAILERFCPSLCEAVTGRSDSQIILKQLEQHNLFLIPLDEEHFWYRYHRLFAQYLRTELAGEEQEALQLKAAEWFAEHNYHHTAVQHLLQTKAALAEPLSPRETEILELVAEGATNEDLAQRLVITLGTAKWHLSNIYGKLGVNSRTQAVQRAHKLQLI